MDDLHRVLHDHRKSVDHVTNSVRALRDMPQALVASREIALAITKLQEAKMWLGKALEEAGSQLPAQFQDKAGQASSQPAEQTSQAQSATPVTPVQPAAEAPAQPDGNQAQAQPANPPTDGQTTAQ